MRLFLLILIPIIGLVSGRMPDYIQFNKCPRQNPQLSECLKNLLENDLKPYILKGIPEINLAALDPFKIKSITMNALNMTGMTIRCAIRNLEARGMGNSKILKFKADLNKKAMAFTLLIPKLTLVAEYDSTGTMIITVPSASTGFFNAEFLNIKAKIMARGNIERQGDLEYLQLPKLSISLSFGNKSTMHVDPNETDKNTRLNVQLLNSLPASTILRWMKFAIEMTLENIVKDQLNSLLSQLPLQDILLDS